MEPRPIAITLLGATGAVGRAVLEVLEDLDVPVGRVRLLATARSAGQELEFRGGPLKVEVPSAEAFAGCDVAILVAGAEASREWAPRARAAGCLVVDDSSAFRGDAERAAGGAGGERRRARRRRHAGGQPQRRVHRAWR